LTGNPPSIPPAAIKAAGDYLVPSRINLSPEAKQLRFFSQTIAKINRDSATSPDSVRVCV